MTSSANDKWKHFELMQGIWHLHQAIRKLNYMEEAPHQVEWLRHTIEFIEYNMKELEITGGNGDE